ncbi:lysylphosphatidylglycerol synthase transmembrane domain-containing protein [Candidatus Omnitrophota bacterium]
MMFLTRKRVYVTLFLIITVLFVLFIRENMDYLRRASQVNIGILLIVVVLALTNRVINGLKIKVTAKVLGADLSFMDWYGMAVINNFYNYFLSKSGTALAASYAKKAHDFPYSRYMSLVMGDVLLMFTAAGVLGLTASFYGAVNGLLEGWIPSILFLCFLLTALCVILLPNIKFPEKGILIKVNKVMHGWNTIRKNTALVFKLFFLNLTLMVLFGVRYYIIFRVFSSNIPLFLCLLISPINFIVQILSIIPSAYGVREALSGLITKLANFGFVPGAMASIVDRVIMMSIAFIQGPIFSYLLIKRTGLRLEEQPNEN